jgi:endogenous inhibitor of DNA gyrase (YacG/DUF329 family)
VIRGRCPICKKEYQIAALADLPSFPFCTERCRLIDLGRWIDEKYVVSRPEAPPEEEADADEDGSE